MPNPALTDSKSPYKVIEERDHFSQAVVVGASVAGLFAARALSDFFERVVVIDRDNLNTDASPRKAVPQGGHIHGILPPTYKVLQQLMPRLIEQLISGGAHVFDGGRDLKWRHLGRWLARGETGQTFIGSTRPFFEYHLRRYVEGLSNVELKPGYRFSKWRTDSSGNRISGLMAEGPGEEIELDSNLTVDARGSGSTLSKELVDLGFEGPETEVVEVELSYTSRLFKSADFSPDWNLLLLDPEPKGWIGGIMERVEDDRWMVTLWGYFGDKAPREDAGFQAFAQALAAPDISVFLQNATPVSDYRGYGIPKCHLHHFDRLKNFPDRLLVMGDAVCKLNPIYAQGMTKAAKESMFLWESLSSLADKGSGLDGFSESFRSRMGNVGANWAWELTSGADLAYPQTRGKRPLSLNLTNWYVNRLFARAEERLEVRRSLMDAMALVKPPDSLMRPGLAFRALGF